MLISPLQLVITGFHRSGTSLLAEYLAACAVNIGATVKQAELLECGSLSGHSGDPAFRDLHHHALQDRNIDLFAEVVPDPTFRFTSAEREIIQDLIEQRRIHPVWGFKDPRTCLFLDAWLECLPEAEFVFIVRDPLEAVGSLVRRNRDTHVVREPLIGLRSWLVHNHLILRFALEHQRRCTLVRHELFNESAEAVVRGLVERRNAPLEPVPPSRVFRGRFVHRQLTQPLRELEQGDQRDVVKEAYELHRRMVELAVPRSSDSSPQPRVGPHDKAFPADDLIRCAEACHDGALTNLVFANAPYLAPLLNFLVALNRLGLDPPMVVSLDKTTYDFLSKRGFPTVLVATGGSFREVQITRIRVLKALVEAGIDLIHSDIDAIWLRDPRQRFFHAQTSSLVASSGTVFPPAAHQRWGFVLCFGHFFVRSNQATRRLFEGCLEYVTERGDQDALNSVLLDHDTCWSEDQTATLMEQKGIPVKCYPDLLHGSSESLGLSVSLLPHRLFQRLPGAPSDDEKPYLRHPLCEKDGRDKMRAFRKAGCLFLRDEWQQIDFDHNSVRMLDRKQPRWTAPRIEHQRRE